MRITYAINIMCKPEDVFPWVAEPEKALLWQSGVSGGEIIKETPDKIGTTFTEKMEEDGNCLEMKGVITDYRRNELIAFHLESRIHRVDVSYTIAGDVDKSTFSMDSTIHWKFPLNIASFFIGNKMKENILQQTRAEFAELKRLCESEAANSG